MSDVWLSCSKRPVVVPVTPSPPLPSRSGHLRADRVAGTGSVRRRGARRLVDDLPLSVRPGAPASVSRLHLPAVAADRQPPRSQFHALRAAAAMSPHIDRLSAGQDRAQGPRRHLPQGTANYRLLIHSDFVAYCVGMPVLCGIFIRNMQIA